MKRIVCFISLCIVTIIISAQTKIVHSLDAGIIVPWTIWKQFGDTAIIEEHWQSMKRYMDHVNATKYDHNALSKENGNYQHGDCLQTGFLGTSILMPTLTNNGMTDVAYTSLSQRPTSTTEDSTKRILKVVLFVSSPKSIPA